MDTFEIAQLMTDSTHQRSPKIRYGVVASLDAGIAITVRPDGQTDTIPAVRCCHPEAGDRVALLVTETEWLAVAVVGGDRSSDDFAPKTHRHAASDITSGTLPVARGGTGVTTAAAIALLAYPVGAVYISYVSTSPASLFGGTWTAITGRFPYFNAGTATGGSNSVVIDFNHTHAMNLVFSSSYIYNSGLKYTNWESVPQPCIATNDSAWTDIGSPAIGSKKTLEKKSWNNMPAYQTLYAWRRTA